MNSLLSSTEVSDLNQALYFMKMQDLKYACQMFALSEKGKKIELIHRIITFIKTGEITHSPIVPLISCAKNYPPQLLHLDSLMLYGSYKNDLKTRIFFKKHIGNYFHFTAYGVDWLNERWLSGNPPTYREFIDYWVKETMSRKQKKVSPKKEWALINFMQSVTKTHPNISQYELMSEWKKIQEKQTRVAYALLKKFSNNKNHR